MDKFDERVKGAQEDYKPTDGFVDRTMEEVRKHRIQRRGFRFKIWAPAAAGAAVVIIIAIVFAPKVTHNDLVDGSKTPSYGQKSTQSSPTASPAPISDGTDDASLQSDLNSIQASMGQSSNEQSSSDSAVNDNQQEISIPTN